MFGLTKKQFITLAIIIIGSFVTMLNQTLIAPALPAIMTELNVHASTVQWLTTGFTLVNAIMIPVTAYLQDRFSIKVLFLFSMALFTLGSFLAGWAPTFTVLLIGRVVQAAGVGILMPMSMTVLLVFFPIEHRGSAMGIFGLVNAFAPAIGPTVSGVIVDNASWHLMFYGISFFSFLGILAAAIFIENKPPDHTSDSRLDPLSVALSSLGFGGMLYGFSMFGSTGLTPLSIAAVVLGTAMVVWFFIRQTHLEVPLLRVRVLKNPKFLIATIIGMLVQAALLCAPILMPIYVQNLMGYSATVSGLVLMPGAVVMAIMNPVAGKWFDKHGPRKLGLVGMGLLTITTAGFGFLNLHSSIFFICLLYLTRMFSMALVNMPITTWGMNALDTKYMNHGTSVNNTLRQVAGSLGTAIVISISSGVQSAGTSAFGSAQATMYGINVAFMASALMIMAGFVLTFVFVKGKPGHTDAIGTVDEFEIGYASANKSLLQSIMKTDVYTLYPTDTVETAMKLFIDKHISACPIVDQDGEPIGFISDGDILNMLSRQDKTYMDPVALIALSSRDESPYNEKLERVMQLPVSAVGARQSIGVNVHADIAEVCRVLAQNHLKKVPVLDNGHIVGIVNRSDITQYSMEAYLKGRADLAVYYPPKLTPEPN